MSTSDDKKREDCLAYLHVFYGLEGMENHYSCGSGQFYQWTLTKFGRELVSELEKELGIEEPGEMSRGSRSLPRSKE